MDLTRRQLNLTIADAEGRAAGKAKSTAGLKLGGESAGGLAASTGAGFKKMPGAARRSAKSKRRDKGKGDFRQERKDGGKK